MKKLSVVLLFVVLSSPSIGAQQKYALVIGNGAYTSLARLNNPVNDANDMAAALRGLGFTVDVAANAGRVQMEEAIERFKNRLSVSKDSYGFLFYAGHGVQSGGVNYLIPVDADIRSEAYLRDRAVSVQAMLDEINEARNALNIVVLDACRDNPFGWARSGSRGLQVVGNQPADSIIVYATSAGATAADGAGRNGLFTSQLLKNLKTPGLEVREVFRRTHADVRQASDNAQRPAMYDQFGGLAYLDGKPAVSPAQPEPQPKPASVQPLSPQPERAPANMVRIQGGTFMMGSPSSEPERLRGEGPQHQVTVSSFYMGKCEVTQKEWQEVMGNNPSYFKGANLPVENVSWYDAIEFCNRLSQREGLTPAYTIDKSRNDPNNTSDDNVRWLVTWNRNANGYRLPTEAEWEYACRAGTTTPFNTGNNISANVANYNGNYPYNNGSKGTYRGKTTTAGSFAPNAWGLYDTHGNVWEWCWDWDGDYASGAQADPRGAVAGTYRVRRGGSWNDYAQYLRSAYRGSNIPLERNYLLGFRLARGG